jgi:hypothetical protein
MLQSEVLQPLETTRNKIKEQLSTVQEYRLLVALEKCIAQIPDISNDTMTTLERVRERLKECLQEVRDYRALRAIEETIVEVRSILAEAPSAVQPQAAVDCTGRRAISGCPRHRESSITLGHVVGC